MIYLDMHVHSTFSKHPSEWFLQRIGAQESYTDVETVYELAKKRGMSFVTLTDHNSIDGARKLRELYPEDTFISVEITSYFPETGCKVHILAYDITDKQFDDIQKIRMNVYDLRNYLKENHIACSVAHATYSVNGRISLEILEKLILLFDVFEGINGSRNRIYNETWVEVLKNLTPEHIKMLYDKYQIEPWSNNPWVKGFTGGSDDHAGLLIGESYTAANCSTIEDFLQALRNKKSVAGGRYGDHKSLALAVYKIAYDFSKHNAKDKQKGSLLNIVNSIMFDNGRLDLKNWLAMQRMKMKKNTDQDKIILRFYEEITSSRFNIDSDVDEQIDKIYQSISRLADDYFNIIISSLERDVNKGDTGKVLRSISAAIPAVFLSAPFFTTMHHLNKNRKMLADLKHKFVKETVRKEKKVLWFSDTVTDLNGVAVTMRNLAQAAYQRERDLKLVTSMPEDEFANADLPPNVINLPNIYNYSPDFYSAITLRFPSYLKSIDIIANENPDEIIISTPGPIGILGLIASRLLDIKCTGIYHTDFTKQVQTFIDDEWIAEIIERFTIYYYRLMDGIRVPTEQYRNMLSDRGIERERTALFKRGIASSFASIDKQKQAELKTRYDLDTGFIVMYSGRLGKEKNLKMLLDVFAAFKETHGNGKLLIVGDGPEMNELKRLSTTDKSIVLAGHIRHEDLPDYYAIADAFVFPSTTDTFGMAVLEAQACGLPTLVTNEGGPQEIVQHEKTGFVLNPNNSNEWVDILINYANLKEKDPEQYQKLRIDIMCSSQSNYGWDAVINDIMGEKQSQTNTLVDMKRKAM